MFVVTTLLAMEQVQHVDLGALPLFDDVCSCLVSAYSWSIGGSKPFKDFWR
jgi:hypothetical protein